MGMSNSNLRVGDLVRIGVTDEDVLAQMQEQHGGWNPVMKECIKGPCKIMQGLQTDVILRAPSGAVYRVNIDLLVRHESSADTTDVAQMAASQLSEGQTVWVITDEDKLQRAQINHGGWDPSTMRNLLGKPVTVVKKFPEGDCKVRADNGNIFTINAHCLLDSDPAASAASGATKLRNFVVPRVGDVKKIIQDKQEVQTLQTDHGGWSDVMQLILGEEVEIVEVGPDNDCFVRVFGMEWMVNPAIFDDASRESNAKKGVKFRPRQKVKICSDKKLAEQLQENHGGWVPPMENLLGKVAVVQDVMPTRDVKVKYGMISFVLNPMLLTLVEDDSEEAEDEEDFNVGDMVCVLKDKKKVKSLQPNHGEWVESMVIFLGEKGKVKSIFPDGDLRVKIMGRSVTLNPKCVTKVTDDEDTDEEPDMLKMLRHMAQMINDSDDDDDDETDKSKKSETTDVDQILQSKNREFLFAVKEGNLSKVKELLNFVGPNATMKSISALHVAVSDGHTDIVKFLIEKNADINIKDKDGDTALHLAVHKNRMDIAKFLLQKKAEINVQNESKLTPVMLASAKGHLEILRLCLETKRVDLKLSDGDKDTALHLAVQKNRPDVVKLLIDHGASIDQNNEKNFSPFFMSVLRGNTEMVKIFLDKAGPSIVDQQKDDHFAALHVAAINNHASVIELLLEHNADVNVRNNKKQTPLHLAVSQKYLGCVKILIEHHADPNLRDDSGDTPLHDAIRNHNMDQMKDMGRFFGMGDMLRMFQGINKGDDKPEDIVMYLVANKAKLDICNGLKKTPLDSCTDEHLKSKLKNISEGKSPELNKSQQENADKTTGENEQKMINDLRKKIQELEDTKTCSICYDKAADTVFQCGHVCCDTCSRNIFECHVCRTPIKRKTHMYN